MDVGGLGIVGYVFVLGNVVKRDVFVGIEFVRIELVDGYLDLFFFNLFNLNKKEFLYFFCIFVYFSFFVGFSS